MGWKPVTSPALVPVSLATIVTLALYYNLATLLLLKIGEVVNGTFDTTVPAFPLAGMFFVVLFIGLRKDDLELSFRPGAWSPETATLGVVMTLAPFIALLSGSSYLAGSYSFAAIALATSWVGVATAIRPSSLSFLWPYLAAFLLAIGSVGLLTTAFGDPLAIVVASLSRAMTTLLSLQVTWTNVYMTFVTAGGGTISLYISQECSGMASMAVFLLLLALMHMDIQPTLRVTALFALGGSLLFIFLNALRVVILIVAGIYFGEGALWNLHGWVGYVLYILGYSGLLVAYMKVKGRGNGVVHALVPDVDP